MQQKLLNNSYFTPVRLYGPLRISKFSRKKSCTVAFRNGDEPLSLQLDYYKVLNVTPTCTKDKVRKSYQDLVSLAPSLPFSPATMFSRAVVLKAAVDCLTDVELRKAYDRKLQHGVTDLKIPAEDLPGVLVLLHENGQYDLVIELGKKWLVENQASPDKNDVAGCLALAYCDRGSMLLKQPSASVKDIYEDLERALMLLKGAKVALALQDQLQDALNDLETDYAIELLALPLRMVEERSKAMSKLIGFLKESNDAGDNTPALPADYIARLRKAVTTTEQVEIWAQMPEHKGKWPELYYDTALAYLVEGYVHGLAHLIYKADTMFKAMAIENESASDSSQYRLERSVCALLLGDVDGAHGLLGLRQVDEVPFDTEVANFVKEYSESQDDLLPGLCVMAERWLEEVALPSFRNAETNDKALTLSAWFTNPSVTLYLKVFQATQIPAILVTCHLLISFVKFLLQWLSPPQVRLQEGETSDDETLVRELQNTMTASMEAGLATAKAPKSAVFQAARMAGTGPAPTTSPASAAVAAVTKVEEEGVASRSSDQIVPSQPARYTETSPARASSTSGTPATNGKRSSDPVPTRPDSSEVGAVSMQALKEQSSKLTVRDLKSRLAQEEDLAEETRSSDRRQQASPPSTSTRTAPTKTERTPTRRPKEPQESQGNDIELLEENEDVVHTGAWSSDARSLRKQLSNLESSMWDAPEGSQGASLAKVLIAGLGIALFLAGAFWLRSSRGLTSLPAPPAVAATTSVMSTFTTTEAEMEVRRWMAVKRAALGPTHRVEVLADVVQGDLLDRWRGLALQLRDNNLYWDYELHSLQINQVTEYGKNRVVIEVSLDETGRLLNQNAPCTQVTNPGFTSGSPESLVNDYKSKYTMLYTLQNKHGSWKFVDAVMLEG